MMKSVKKLSSYLLLFAFVFAIGLFLSSPARYAKSILEGISLWAVNVLPVVFPLIALTSLLGGIPAFADCCNKLSPAVGKLFRVSGEGAGAALLAACSGYPAGAKLAGSLYRENRIAKHETFPLACLCSVCSPAFLIGCVGGVMFRSAKIGAVMFLSHLLAVWTFGFVLKFFQKSVPASPAPLSAKKVDLFESVSSAVISVLCVGGFIALFHCLGQMLSDLGIFTLFLRIFGNSSLAEGVLGGFWEMTFGCSVLSKTPSALSASLACAVVTFGGLCVFCQQLAFLQPTGINAFPFFLAKLTQAVLAFFFCRLFFGIFGF